MENMKINNKNIADVYQPTPTLFYDIEGKVVENNGKNIKIEKTINNKVIEYSLKVKEEIDAKIGENVKIEKENISSIKSEEKEEIMEEETRDAAEALKDLGLAYTEENIRMIENLIKSGIPITKNRVDSYKKSKEYLNEIIENINPEAFVKLIDRGIDIEGESLQKIAEGLEDIKNEKKPFSIKRFLKLEKDLDYKEAEVIAKEIYGQKMGKDVYDTIIALHKEKLPIIKENIETTTEVMAKLYNLKSIKDESYVEILNENKDFNINNLFKLKNSYTTKPIEDNILSRTFEQFTVVKETTIESLKEILSNLNIEDSAESISILREFIIKDMNMDKESYDKVVSMKASLSELRELASHGDIGKLIHNDIDPMTEDINELIDALKAENLKESPIDDIRKDEITRDLEILGNIKDRDLLQLLKQGEDFNLRTIRQITNTNVEKELTVAFKTMEKANYIGNILNSLGENLDPQIVSLASRKHDFITLNNLYTSQEQLKTLNQTIKPIESISETLIFDEYLRARNSLTTNMIKESIKDGTALEYMPLNELNLYIEKKINRYKESDRMTKEIRDIKGNYEKILPMIMKNEISMTLKEIKDINLFLNGEKGLTNLLKNMTLEENKELKEEINILQEKISSSLKEGSEKVKDDYKDLMNMIGSSNKSFEDKGNNQRNKAKDEYIETNKKISKNDMVIKLPIDTGSGYKDLNIIVPDAAQGIDKNNMKFLVSLETEHLGEVLMDLKVVGKEIYINIEEQEGALEDRIILLKESLEKIGYTLNIEVEPKVS